jgi:hypothetical protein
MPHLYFMMLIFFLLLTLQGCNHESVELSQSDKAEIEEAAGCGIDVSLLISQFLFKLIKCSRLYLPLHKQIIVILLSNRKTSLP